jgi:hypothetical protein
MSVTLLKNMEDNKHLTYFLSNMDLLIPPEIYLTFDPTQLTDEELIQIFANEHIKIIYCCIRSSHIVDQFFAEKILELKRKLYDPWTFEHFMKITYLNPYLQNYGTKVFWGQVWEILNHKRKLRILPINAKKLSFVSRDV